MGTQDHKQEALTLLEKIDANLLKELMIKNVELDLITVRKGRISEDIYLDAVGISEDLIGFKSYKEIVDFYNNK